MPYLGGGVIPFFARKKVSKTCKGSALDPWGNFRFYQSHSQSHSTANKFHRRQGDFRYAKIKGLQINRSFKVRLNSSIIARRISILPQSLNITQQTCSAHHI